LIQGTLTNIISWPKGKKNLEKKLIRLRLRISPSEEKCLRRF